MRTGLSEARKRTLLVAIIALNGIVLALIASYVLTLVGRSHAEKRTGLGWGDPIPDLPPLETPQGEHLSLIPDEPAVTTLLFMFDANGTEAVRRVTGEIIASGMSERLVRLVGIFEGSAADWKSLGPEGIPGVPIAVDPGRVVRKTFGIPDESSGGYTLAIGRDARVHLAVSAIVHSDLLIDYSARQAPGSAVSLALDDTLDSPEPVQILPHEAESPARGDHSAATWRATPAPGSASTAGELRLVRLHRESRRGAGRLTMAEDGTVYALSRRYHKIWILDRDFTLVGRLGGFGQGPRDLLMPYDLDVEPEGNVVVVERGNLRLQKLSPDGESLLRVPLDPNASSVAVSPRGTLFVANSKSGAQVLRFDESAQRFEPLIGYRGVPWLRERVGAQVESWVDRERLAQKYEMALNEVYLRFGPPDRLFVLPVWDPTLSVYDSSGQRLMDIPFTFQGLEELTEEFFQTMDEMLATGTVGVRLVFQDMAIDSSGKTVALAISGTCPGVVLLELESWTTTELCLIDEEGRPFPPGTILAAGEDRWLVANELGIYSFEISR